MRKTANSFSTSMLGTKSLSMHWFGAIPHHLPRSRVAAVGGPFEATATTKDFHFGTMERVVGDNDTSNLSKMQIFIKRGETF